MKNLIIRTISGLLFLVIMVSAILYDHITFWAVSCIIVAIGMYEFFNLTIPKADAAQKSISMFAGIILLSFILVPPYEVFESLANFFLMIIVCLFTLIPIIELYKKSEKPFENIALLVLPIIYIAVPFTFLNFAYVAFDKRGFFVLAFFIFVWASDVGAYCFGMLFGKHKLFPRISPKKSWEGFFGGIITAIVASILVSKFMFSGESLHWMHWMHWIIISVITSVFGVFGDLVMSMLKRSAGVKDSGNIMAGHGGILDRFDAVFLAFPVVFVYMIIIFYL